MRLKNINPFDIDFEEKYRIFRRHPVLVFLIQYAVVGAALVASGWIIASIINLF